ncbi:MAG: SRPBCC domain-containing protein [Chloroflexi bacterium]|nr:SRPBCC domain-containing protein [Chloroflexota bacterium]OJV91060.1 MAG: hypothetical protein BGO39_05310 [Chloroflexi bacterium 54-19]
MPDILIEATIAVAPDKVFEAISTQKGLASWWTTHITAQPKVGSTVRASFRNDERAHVFEVTALEPTSHIAWRSTQSFLPDWPGTRLTWDLMVVDEGTKLLFSQRGYATENGSLPLATFSWVTVITRMKEYLERGQTTPHSY